MRIHVRLIDARKNLEKAFKFDRSPVRIGRNPTNDIILDDGFVSGCHGLIRFDAAEVSYVDLGSRNGTAIEGKQLQAKEPYPLRKDTRVTIWFYDLIVVSEGPGSEASNQPDTPENQTRMTLPLNALAISLVSNPPATKKQSSTSPVDESGLSSGVLSTIHKIREELAPQAPVGPAGSPPEQGDGISDRLVRCIRILDAFSKAFISLKKGYEQFGSEIGVRPLHGSTPLHRARSSEELVRYFLDPATPIDQCAEILLAIIRDMGIHDVALMEGVTQGAKGMLRRLDPATQKIKLGSGLWSGGSAKEAWLRYQEQFTELLQDDELLHRELFGAEFARSYSRMTVPDEEE